MLGLSELNQTKVYQEAVEEGELRAKLEAIPRLLRLGLEANQIAQALVLPLEKVRQVIEQQSFHE
jgi:predicted transposase/invertase (TIGR01784 family)